MKQSYFKQIYCITLYRVNKSNNYMNIFYVDDDPEDAEIFADAIREIDSSINCKIFRTGKDALKILTVPCPDYIFIDFRMPLMDGKNILKEIQSNECFKFTKMIMYSTHMHEHEIEECKKLGAHYCLKKTGDFTIFCNELRALLNES
jgi:CheY-like chemotaxis protein